MSSFYATNKKLVSFSSYLDTAPNCSKPNRVFGWKWKRNNKEEKRPCIRCSEFRVHSRDSHTSPEQSHPPADQLSNQPTCICRGLPVKSSKFVVNLWNHTKRNRIPSKRKSMSIKQWNNEASIEEKKMKKFRILPF